MEEKKKSSDKKSNEKLEFQWKKLAKPVLFGLQLF